MALAYSFHDPPAVNTHRQLAAYGNIAAVNWPKAIGEEFAIAIRLTFADLRAPRRWNSGWLRDRHLRRGAITALPFAFLFLYEGITHGPPASETCLALLANAVWLGVSAWDRERSRQ